MRVADLVHEQRASAPEIQIKRRQIKVAGEEK